jgi:hypothetical protein
LQWSVSPEKIPYLVNQFERWVNYLRLDGWEASEQESLPIDWADRSV